MAGPAFWSPTRRKWHMPSKRPRDWIRKSAGQRRENASGSIGWSPPISSATAGSSARRHDFGAEDRRPPGRRSAERAGRGMERAVGARCRGDAVSVAGLAGAVVPLFRRPRVAGGGHAPRRASDRHPAAVPRRRRARPKAAADGRRDQRLPRWRVRSGGRERRGSLPDRGLGGVAGARSAAASTRIPASPRAGARRLVGRPAAAGTLSGDPAPRRLVTAYAAEPPLLPPPDRAWRYRARDRHGP